jgi:hypothetical protein
VRSRLITHWRVSFGSHQGVPGRLTGSPWLIFAAAAGDDLMVSPEPSFGAVARTCAATPVCGSTKSLCVEPGAAAWPGAMLSWPWHSADAVRCVLHRILASHIVVLYLCSPALQLAVRSSTLATTHPAAGHTQGTRSQRTRTRGRAQPRRVRGCACGCELVAAYKKAICVCA